MVAPDMQLVDSSGRYVGSSVSLINSSGQISAAQLASAIPAGFEVQQPVAGNELIGYYFGSISRETAEWILKNHGNPAGGAYLLRSSGPNDDFVLSLSIVGLTCPQQLDVLHYKIVETEDSFVALHGQLVEEKFATIDELIDKAQGVAIKPRWPIMRQSLESQILPPTYWGLSVDQVRLAILIKAKQWGFPLLASLFQQGSSIAQELNLVQEQQQSTGSIQQASDTITATTLNNETIRTLIYKSLHEFQPWFHGKISREDAERRIEEGPTRDGKFLVRERDNYSYAMCISHKRTTKHYRIDVLPTGELAIQDGRKFTSLMSLVSHYTIMSDGLWCALTEACARPIQAASNVLAGNGSQLNSQRPVFLQPLDNGQPKGQRVKPVKSQQDMYCIAAAPTVPLGVSGSALQNQADRADMFGQVGRPCEALMQPQQRPGDELGGRSPLCDRFNSLISNNGNMNQLGAVSSIKAPIREWLQTINHKWSQLMASKSHHQQSLNSFLFGAQNPLNNHCRHHNRHRHHHLSQQEHQQSSRNQQAKRKCRNGHGSCANRDRDKSHSLASAKHLQLATKQQVNMAANFQAGQAGRQDSLTSSFAHGNCCHNINGSNLVFPPGTGANNRSILSHLPQNSGFTLNSQSFIGSPLFSVRQQQQQQPVVSLALAGNKPAGQSQAQVSGSSGSSIGSARGGEAGSSSVEESGEAPRLISPAQSISANLGAIHQPTAGNPYPQVADIYAGSQASTVLINDHLQPATSSSSSSARTGNLIQHAGCISAAGLALLHRHQPAFNTLPSKMADQCEPRQQQPDPLPRLAGEISRAGRIICGQHAGPAFRYTNCDDDNLTKQCFHHQRAQVAPPSLARAADDLHLNGPSSQLVGPAALTKFVQFQDGQCLRTHRDTMSIKMAYLSSRQPADYQVHSLNQQPVEKSQQSGARQQPFISRNKEHAHVCPPASNNATDSYNSNLGFALNNSLSYGLVGSRLSAHDDLQQVQQLSCMGNNGVKNVMPRESMQADYQLPTIQLALRTQTTGALPRYPGSHGNNQLLDPAEIDLMDCGDDTEGRFSFKYDPKLIKSSSIETLCGHNNSNNQESNNHDDELLNYKSNRELLMSLQKSHQLECQSSILSPMQVFSSQTNRPAIQLVSGDDDEEEEDEEDNESARRAESFLNKLMSGSAAPGLHVDEKLSHMSKKHDIDALTTSLLEELTASLKAQVDLKNKRSGLAQTTQASFMEAPIGNQQGPEGGELAGSRSDGQEHKLNGQQIGCNSNNDNHQLIDGSGKLAGEPMLEVNPLELINEFDTLVSNNR